MSNKTLLISCLALLLFAGACNKSGQGISWNFLDKNKLDIQQMDFEYFSGKAKINYKDDDLDIKARANIRMKKDSAIWIAFSAIGIQGARCLITKDSITIINMVKKEYYVFDYDSLTKQFDFDISYEAIQSAALCNLIIPRNKQDQVIKESDFYLLKQNVEHVAVNNFVNPKTMKIERVEMLESESRNSAVLRYYDFQMVGKHAFPFSAFVSLFYKADGRTLNTVIEFEYNKAEIEEKALKFPFSIPKKYVRK